MRVEFTYVRDDGRGPGTGSVPRDHDKSSLLTVVMDTGFDRIAIDGAVNLEAVIGASELELCIDHLVGPGLPVDDAARLAALDGACQGRLALRVLPLAPSRVLSDSDAPGHLARQKQFEEYLTLLKRLWTNPRPFDHEGRFYRVENGFVPDKGPRGGAIPLRLNGLSGTALGVAGRHADVFELPPAAPEELRALIGRVRQAAAAVGRAKRIRFALPIGFDRHDAGLVAIPDGPAQATAALLRHAELGIDEFMVIGLKTTAEVAEFGRRYATVFRNSLARIRPDGAAGPVGLGRKRPDDAHHAWWSGFGRWPS